MDYIMLDDVPPAPSSTYQHEDEDFDTNTFLASDEFTPLPASVVNAMTLEHALPPSAPHYTEQEPVQLPLQLPLQQLQQDTKRGQVAMNMCQTILDTYSSSITIGQLNGVVSELYKFFCFKPPTFDNNTFSSYPASTESSPVSSPVSSPTFNYSGGETDSDNQIDNDPQSTNTSTLVPIPAVAAPVPDTSVTMTLLAGPKRGVPQIKGKNFGPNSILEIFSDGTYDIHRGDLMVRVTLHCIGQAGWLPPIMENCPVNYEKNSTRAKLRKIHIEVNKVPGKTVDYEYYLEYTLMDGQSNPLATATSEIFPIQSRGLVPAEVPRKKRTPRPKPEQQNAASQSADSNTEQGDEAKHSSNKKRKM